MGEGEGRGGFIYLLSSLSQMLVSAYYLQALLVITKVEVTPRAASQEEVSATERPVEHASSPSSPRVQSTHGIASSESKVCVYVFVCVCVCGGGGSL